MQSQLDFLSYLPLIIIPIVLLSVAVPLFFVWKVFKGRGETAKLLQTGTPAMATILSIWETGLRINNQPEIGFQLRVQPQGGQPFDTQAKAIISMLQIAQIQPGAQVQVRYNPQNPAECAVVI